MVTTRSVARSNSLRHTLRPLRVLPFGHSIVAGDKDISGNNVILASTFMEQAAFRSGKPCVLIGNMGVPGETVQQIEARLPAVIAAAPDVVPIMAMTNNMISGMNNVAWSAALGSYERIIVGLLSAGILPIICTDPPKNAAQAETRLLQPYLYMLAEFYGVPLADCYRTVVNAITGNWLSGKTSDNVHPNQIGGDLMAGPLASVLTNLQVAAAPVYLAAVSEAAVNAEANLIRNGSFAQQTTAGVPDSWTTNTGSGTRTATATAALPFSGIDFQYQLTSGAAAYALAGGDFNGFTAGDVLRFSGRMLQSGMTIGGANGATSLFLQGSAGIIRPVNGSQYNTDHRFSLDFTVPAGVTAYSPNLIMSQNGQVVVNNLTAINLTALGSRWKPGQQAL